MNNNFEVVRLDIKGGSRGFFCEICTDYIEGAWRGAARYSLSRDGCYGHYSSPSKWDIPHETREGAIKCVCDKILCDRNLDDNHTIYSGEKMQRDALLEAVGDYKKSFNQPKQLSLFD